MGHGMAGRFEFGGWSCSWRITCFYTVVTVIITEEQPQYFVAACFTCDALLCSLFKFNYIMHWSFHIHSFPAVCLFMCFDWLVGPSNLTWYWALRQLALTTRVLYATWWITLTRKEYFLMPTHTLCGEIVFLHIIIISFLLTTQIINAYIGCLHKLLQCSGSYFLIASTCVNTQILTWLSMVTGKLITNMSYYTWCLTGSSPC